MADLTTFQYGGTSFPLSTSSVNSTLQDADPALYYALDFFEAVINLHVGDRMLKEAAAAGITNITSAVAYKTPLDPLPWLLDNQFQWPLLACYRRKGKFGYRTTNWSHDVSQWGVAYILPPLTQAQAEIMMPFLTAISKTLYNRMEQGFDPNYRAAQKVWTLAGLEEIDILDHSTGVWLGKDDIPFMGWQATIQLMERQQPETDLSKLAGVDAAVDLTDDQAFPGDPITDFVDFKSDVEPSPPFGK